MGSVRSGPCCKTERAERSNSVERTDILANPWSKMRKIINKRLSLCCTSQEARHSFTRGTVISSLLPLPPTEQSVQCEYSESSKFLPSEQLCFFPRSCTLEIKLSELICFDEFWHGQHPSSSWNLSQGFSQEVVFASYSHGQLPAPVDARKQESPESC